MKESILEVHFMLALSASPMSRKAALKSSSVHSNLIDIVVGWEE